MPRLRLPQRPGWLTRQRLRLAGVLLLLILLSLALTSIQPSDLAGAWRWTQTLPARLRGWAWQARWLWPWLVTLTVVTLTRSPVRGWWARQSRLVQLGCMLAVVVLGLGMAGLLVPGLLVLGAVAAIALLAALVLVVPARQAPPLPHEVLEGLSELERREKQGERARLQNELRATPLQFIVGPAVLAGAVLGFQQLTEDRRQALADRELTRQGQASERFTTAIDQLGSDRTETRIGGIYGLEHIARQVPDTRLAVIEVLVAYVRRRTPPAPDPRDAPASVARGNPAPDVQAALTVLGRRQVKPADLSLNLSSLDLFRAGLSGANLRGANLNGADLTKANLRAAHLGRALLVEANLTGADLSNTDLRGATLALAVLACDVFVCADLTGADLSGADLSGATLYGADLSGADLDSANLRGAKVDASTRWPAGFDWRAAGVQSVG